MFKKIAVLGLTLTTVWSNAALAGSKDTLVQVTVANGKLEGATNPASKVSSFKGIPFAQAPVGNLRWQAPQPAKDWTGVRPAHKFGPNAMQKNVFGDMVFRSSGMSEDCLYLNVWSPNPSGKEKLPVLVYFYGGGFVAGDGSESRYDGEAIAAKGIVSVTVNYRLGIFGFFSHPELTAESPHHASGNYGLLDQQAALAWVQQNIAAFGGDPKRVTIAGESAGSISVCAQMVSPLSRNLIAGAIGESGAMIAPTLPAIPLAKAEEKGVNFSKSIGAASLSDLRAIVDTDLLNKAAKPGAFSTSATVDGYFLPKSPAEIFAAGEQAQVPLLAGWNSTEIPYQAFTSGDAPTPENYHKKVAQQYPQDSLRVLELYPGKTESEVIESATALASDRFIVYSTWKWLELHLQTSTQPVYRYVFGKPRPAMVPSNNNNAPASKLPPPMVGAAHAVEIEYAMGNLPGNKVYSWKKEDFDVSSTMLDYFANFVKTGNPNGKGLPNWPVNKRGEKVWEMHINVKSEAVPEPHRERYLFLDNKFSKG
jgi:para-nitrobenzyl esterase